MALSDKLYPKRFTKVSLPPNELLKPMLTRPELREIGGLSKIYLWADYGQSGASWPMLLRFQSAT